MAAKKTINKFGDKKKPINPDQLTNEGKHGGKLYRAKKGEVLNPKGRPPGTGWRQLVAKILDAEIVNKTTGQKEQHREAVIKSQILKALKGDTRAAEFLRDTEAGGKLKQVVEATGVDGAPISTETKHVVIFKGMDGKG
jgi:hypothetical protein